MSAKDTDSDIALGLGLGADDYITKPFSVTEVLARIKANLRRTKQYDILVHNDEPSKIERCGLSIRNHVFTFPRGSFADQGREKGKTGHGLNQLVFHIGETGSWRYGYN